MKFKSKVIYTSHLDTPLGGMTMAATDQGLAGVWFDQQRHWPDTTGWIAKDDHPALIGAGTQLRPYSQEILEAAYKATNEVSDEVSAKNADFKKVVDSVKTFRNEGYLWFQVAEYAYDTFMIRARARG